MVDSVVESGLLTVAQDPASETLRLSEEARGARCLLCFLADCSASSLDLTFSKILLKSPFLTSAVFSLRVFLDSSDIAGVEYSNGGSANNGISSILVVVTCGIDGILLLSLPDGIKSLSADPCC